MRIKPIINTLITPFKKKKPYVLLSKETGLNINSDRFFPEQLSLETAKKVDVVVIANRKNLEQQKIITTFRDDKNNILERVFEYKGYDLPTVHKLYKKIEGCFFSRLIQTFENLSPKNVCSLWQKVSTEKQFFNKSNNNKTVSIVKVSTKERTLDDVKTEVHSFARYSSKNGKNNDPKILILNIEKDDFGVPIIKSQSSCNIDWPIQDEYLAFRAYDADDVKIPLTKLILRKLGLENLNIKAEKSYYRPKNLLGSFEWKNGIIKYCDEVESKDKAVNTVFHETHHALQYAIMSLFHDLNSNFANFCKNNFKLNKTRELKKVADEYLIAHTNYVPASEDYDKYYNNLLEKEAREIAKAYLAKYFSQSRRISMEFSLSRLES